MTGRYIDGSEDYRGLFGYIFNATVKDLSVSGSVSGGDYTGAVVGYADTSTITNCVSDAAVSGGSNVGGIAGSVQGGTGDPAYISGCVNGGRVSGRESNIGGIAGALSDAIARDCANAGAVTGGGSGNSGIGGIVGYGIAGGVVNCLNRGDVRAENDGANAGGIVGYYSNISAELCTNMGRVYGGGYAGGILGNHFAGDSTVTSCASVGGVSGGGNTGAIVGGAFFTGSDWNKGQYATLSNCLWYESGSVNAGLKAAGDDDDDEGKFTAAMAASADNYGALAATYAPDPASAMIPAGRTKTLFRSWPGVEAGAVTEVSYDVSPDTGLTLSADVNKSVTATMTTSGDYTVSATAEFTTSLLASATQSQHTTEKMTLRVGEGWPYLPVVYVTPNGTGEKDGSSWANAMGGADFSAMLKWINRQNSGTAYEFRVAAGIYAQKETLYLSKGVKLYGGFAGTETDIDAREIAKNVTTLTAATGASISIVTGGEDATSADTVLDGFTITGGKGTNIGDIFGGGMFNISSSPLVANCIFKDNTSDAGGAMLNYYGSSPYVYKCTFEANTGGAVYNVDDGAGSGPLSPRFAECVFKKNTAESTSAGIHNSGDGCRSVIERCRFIENESSEGSAVTDSFQACSVISGSEFTKNISTSTYLGGGAIFIR